MNGPSRELVPAGSGRGEADIAQVGMLVSDRARCQILLALVDGRALSATQLAAEAGVTPATASSHLGKLTQSGLLEVTPGGRNRYYRLSGPEVLHLIEALQRLAPRRPITSLAQDARVRSLRLARTCFDHVGGRLGVALLSAFVSRGLVSVVQTDTACHPAWALEDREIDYRLTDEGAAELRRAGVPVPAELATLRYCVDWSEGGHHLSGFIGRQIRRRMLELGWLVPGNEGRSLRITDLGRTKIPAVLGVPVEALNR